MRKTGVLIKGESCMPERHGTLTRKWQYVAVLLLAFGLPFPAIGADDFTKGLAAFEREDYDQAREIWEPLAEQGHARAQYRLGRIYEKGKGVWRNFHAAAKWYLRAAHNGDADAQYRLSVAYAYGLGGLDWDETRDLMWWGRAAAEAEAVAVIRVQVHGAEVDARVHAGLAGRRGPHIAEPPLCLALEGRQVERWFDLAHQGQDNSPRTEAQTTTMAITTMAICTGDMADTSFLGKHAQKGANINVFPRTCSG